MSLHFIAEVKKRGYYDPHVLDIVWNIPVTSTDRDARMKARGDLTMLRSRDHGIGA